MVVPFMTDAEFDDLEPLMADGWATLGEWYGDMTVTVARQGVGEVGTFSVVSIGLAARQERPTGAGTPVAQTEQSGTLRLWTADITDGAILRGDRFIWNGQACVIAAVGEHKRGGVTEYAFALAGRNA